MDSGFFARRVLKVPKYGYRTILLFWGKRYPNMDMDTFQRYSDMNTVTLKVSMATYMDTFSMTFY